MNTIRVKQLGLAAYIKMNGAVLLRVEDRHFVFETSATLDSWRVQYNNSCCMTHDSMVCELRQHIQSVK